MTAVLDTGAQPSYADRAIVTRYAPVDVVEDFHPTVGPFDTPRYRFPVTVRGRRIDAHWGVLPDVLSPLARMAPWILGSDFFRDRKIALDFGRGHVLDLTGTERGAYAGRAVRRLSLLPVVTRAGKASEVRPLVEPGSTRDASGAHNEERGASGTTDATIPIPPGFTVV